MSDEDVKYTIQEGHDDPHGPSYAVMRNDEVLAVVSTVGTLLRYYLNGVRSDPQYIQDGLESVSFQALDAAETLAATLVLDAFGRKHPFEVYRRIGKLLGMPHWGACKERVIYRHELFALVVEAR